MVDVLQKNWLKIDFCKGHRIMRRHLSAPIGHSCDEERVKEYPIQKTPVYKQKT